MGCTLWDDGGGGVCPRQPARRTKGTEAFVRAGNGGDGEGAVHFQIGDMCLKFRSHSPVGAVWHPTKPQVRGTANRTP